MRIRTPLFAALLALTAPAGLAQDPAGEPADPPAPEGVEAAAPGRERPDPSATEGERPSAIDEIFERVKEDQIKILAPTEVPGELARLKSKADIKAEIHRRVSNGRPVVFRGVIRNGKLIEQLRSQHFVPVDTVEAPDCGVRLWWSGNSDGFIFFRYSTIEKIALTGLLTDAEREEILRRLRARDEEKDPVQAAEEAAQKTEEQLAKLPEEQLMAVLIDRYPYEEGWNPERRHQLKLKLVRNEKLTPDETIFLKYYHVLRKARFEELKRRSEKTEIEPGSADDEPSGSGSNRSAGE